MPERMCAVEVLEREAAHELLRPAGLLVDLDRLPRAHDPDLRVHLANPRLGVVRLRLDDEDRVARTHLGVGGAAEGLAKLARKRRPVLEGIGGEEGQLARAARSRVTIDRDARAVGPAIVHLGEHRAQVPPERLFDLSRFCEQPDNSAHMYSTYILCDSRFRMN